MEFRLLWATIYHTKPISRWHRQTDGNTPFASSVEATPIVSDDLSHADTMATGEIRYSSDRGSP